MMERERERIGSGNGKGEGRGGGYISCMIMRVAELVSMLLKRHWESELRAILR